MITEKPNSKTILVVDDNVDAAATLGMFLKLKGYDTKTCNGGREAIEMVREHHVDLVILDLAMPGMDGYETADILRTDYGQSLPLIALSGYSQDEDRRLTTAAGFNAHLVKPVDFVALLDVLSAMLPDSPAS